MAQVHLTISAKTPKARMAAFRVWLFLWSRLVFLLEKTAPGKVTIEFDADRAIAWVGRGIKVKVK